MNHADNKTIGARVIALREGLGMTQEHLAERLKIAPSRVSHYETGRSALPIDIAVRLAKLAKVSLDHLYGGKRVA